MRIKNTLRLASSALLLLSVFSSPPAQAASEVFFTGTINKDISPNGGGTLFERDCEEVGGNVLRGIQAINYGVPSFLSQLEGSCGTSNDGTILTGSYSQLLRTNASEYWGNNSPGAAVMDYCNTNKVVVGATVYEGDAGFVQGIQLKCGDLPAGNNATDSTNVIGVTTANARQIQCSAGTVAIGLAVHSGNIVDRFGIRCRAMNLLHIEPDDQSVDYASSAPTYTHVVTKGSASGDEYAPNPSITGLICTSSYVQFTNVSASPLTITCSGASASGFHFSYGTGTLTINKATPELNYTGTAFVPLGSKINLSSSGIPSYCTLTDKFEYQFSSSQDFETWNSGPVSNSTQQLLTSAVLLTDGLYFARVRYLGDDNCNDVVSDGSDVLTVYEPGTSAFGGGFYTITGAGKANFGFVVKLVPRTNNTYKGQIVWNFKNNWRFKGTLDNFGKSGGNGSASGLGILEYWDPNFYSLGEGDWVTAATSVNVIAKFTPTLATSKKSLGSTGSFVVNFGYTTPSNWQFAPLPYLNTLTPLKGGNITFG